MTIIDIKIVYRLFFPMIAEHCNYQKYQVIKNLKSILNLTGFKEKILCEDVLKFCSSWHNCLKTDTKRNACNKIK